MTPKIQDALPLAPLPIDEAVAPPKASNPVKEQPVAAASKPLVLPTAGKEKGRGRVIRPILYIVGGVFVLSIALYSVLHRLQEEVTRVPPPPGKRLSA